MESRGIELEGVAIMFLTLSLITVLARCWVRIQMIHAFAIDDWLTVVTLFFFILYSSSVFVGIHYGVGRHSYDLTVSQRVNAMHAWYYGEILYIITATLLRLAVGAFLLRVAVRKSHRYTIHTCNAMNILFNLYFVFFTIFQCSPINGFWLRLKGMKNVKCYPHIAVKSTLASSALSAFIDWVFGLLPILIVWGLNINKKKKIALGIIMGLGAIASTAPLVRISYTVSLSKTEDFLWATTDVAIWSYVEPGIGIIAISLAALRPLFVSIFKGLSTSGTAGSRTNQYGTGGRLSKPNIRQGNWDGEGDELQLRGLPPKMGHMVSIEGGMSSRKEGAVKAQKSTSSGSGSRSGKSSERTSEERNERAIMTTYEFKAWSGDDLGPPLHRGDR